MGEDRAEVGQGHEWLSVTPGSGYPAAEQEVWAGGSRQMATHLLLPSPQLGDLLQGLHGLLPLGDGGRHRWCGRGRHPLSVQSPHLAGPPAEL